MSHFGKLKRDPRFQEAFNKCLKFCSTEEEFYASWNQMVEKFNLKNEPWFNKLFELRDKWCNALNKDYFSAGLLSSQRSESTNNAISFKANKSTSLTEFYALFEETVKRWRRVETSDEYLSSLMNANPNIRMHTLLRHALDVYTNEMFQDFENEFQKGICSNVTDRSVVEDTTIYVVEVDDNKYHVCSTSNFMTCSCRRFDEMKLLCSHMLRIMHMNCLQTIPKEFIALRWSKKARDNVSNNSSESMPTNQKQSPTKWRNSIQKKFNNILIHCDENMEARAVIEESLQNLLELTNKFMIRDEKTDNNIEKDATNDGVLDPERSKTKGRRKRIKSSFERNCSKRKIQKQEFGTKTPKVL